MIAARAARTAGALAAAGLLLGACTGSPGAGGGSATTRAGRSGAPADLYLSLGDSYAVGYQPATAAHAAGPSRNGFAYQVVTKAKSRGVDLRLTNLGCSGATSASVFTHRGCDAQLRGPAAGPYSGSQADAAVAFLRAHRGRVALITVVLGGNDIAGCADAGGSAAATTCVTRALSGITANLEKLAGRLRAAAGPGPRIVGLTYPDVFLGEALSDDADRRSVAPLSVFAFRNLINPQLAHAYESAGGRLVDVTAATGAYGSLDRRTTLPPYGSIPEPVAKICTLTYYCAQRDIHPRTVGYGIIAELVVKSLLRR